jgi:hypothetical protein
MNTCKVLDRKPHRRSTGEIEAQMEGINFLEKSYGELHRLKFL